MRPIRSFSTPLYAHLDTGQFLHCRVSLSKSKKKDDFGVVLGCKIYVKEITHRSLADKDGAVAEGDLVAKINGASIEGLTLKEAR